VRHSHSWYFIVMQGSLLTAHLVMRLLRTACVVGVSLLVCGVLARGQEAPPPVYSAVAENQGFRVCNENHLLRHRERRAQNNHAVLRGDRRHRAYVGGGGQDMIDASDPCPGNIEAKKPADLFGSIEP